MGAPVLASRCDALSMRARGSRAFWRNEPNASYSGRPRESGPITTVFGYGSRLSARFAGVGRDDDPVGFVKNQPAGVGHDRRPRSIAQGLLFTMENATRACEP